jgi:hypothetical protein
MEHLSLEELNRVDLFDFLTTIGIQPKKAKVHLYYYLSPFAGHPNHRPTFIVNRRLNRWRETTTKQAGSLADLIVRLYDCTIGELSTILRAALPPVSQSAAFKDNNTAPLISIERTHPIRSTYLEHFLWERRISLPVARQFCIEAWYTRGNNVYASLAFRGDAGGFELFDRNHHYRITPCGPTHIQNNSQSVAVFRDVIDLLTYVTIVPTPIAQLPDFLILNAPVAFPAVQEIISHYRYKHLFLPNDAAGIAFSTQAIRMLPNCFDQRCLYTGYPNLNHWICSIGTAPRPKNPSSQKDMQKRSILNQTAKEKPKKAPTR